MELPDSGVEGAGEGVGVGGVGAVFGTDRRGGVRERVDDGGECRDGVAVELAVAGEGPTPVTVIAHVKVAPVVQVVPSVE